MLNDSEAEMHVQRAADKGRNLGSRMLELDPSQADGGEGGTLP